MPGKTREKLKEECRKSNAAPNRVLADAIDELRDFIRMHETKLAEQSEKIDSLDARLETYRIQSGNGFDAERQKLDALDTRLQKLEAAMPKDEVVEVSSCPQKKCPDCGTIYPYISIPKMGILSRCPRCAKKDPTPAVREIAERCWIHLPPGNCPGEDQYPECSDKNPCPICEEAITRIAQAITEGVKAEKDEHTKDVAALIKVSNQRKADRDRLQAEVAMWRKQAERRNKKKEHWKGKAIEWRNLSRRLGRSNKRLWAEVAQIYEAHDKTVASLKAEVDEARAEHAALCATMGERDADNTELRAEVERLEKNYNAAEAHVKKLSQDLARLREPVGEERLDELLSALVEAVEWPRKTGRVTVVGAERARAILRHRLARPGKVPTIVEMAKKIGDTRWPRDGGDWAGQYVIPGAMRIDVSMELAKALHALLTGTGGYDAKED